MKYADKTVRFTVKLDRGWDEPAEEMVGGALSSVLSGPESDDPSVQGSIEDQASELMESVQASYSQAAAYLILLSRVDWDLGDLVDLIWVGRDTARRRSGRAAGLVAVQPSCFDGSSRSRRTSSLGGDAGSPEFATSPQRGRDVLARGGARQPHALGPLTALCSSNSDFHILRLPTVRATGNPGLQAKVRLDRVGVHQPIILVVHRMGRDARLG